MNAFIADANNQYQAAYSQLQSLQEQLIKETFADFSAQIAFFKETYLPLLVEAKLAYSIWRFELHFPLGAVEHKHKYLHNAFEYLHHFFEKYQSLFVCYRNGDTYFEADMCHVESPQLEMYANVIAALYFEEYLHKRSDSAKPMAVTQASTTLMWTEKQVAFVELVYSLYEIKAFNGGDISLTALTNGLAGCFGVKLTQDPNRIWQDIKSRKKRQTYFSKSFQRR